MRSKPSLRNKVKFGPLKLCLSLSIILFSSCGPFEPSYKEGEIPGAIIRICAEEYKLNVAAKRVGQTLWVYVPVNGMVHWDPEKLLSFDQEFMEALRRAMTTVERVLLNAQSTPEFYILVIADIKVGFGYTFTIYVPDVKKSHANYIPWPEAQSRYLKDISMKIETLGDSDGKWINYYEMTLEKFLALQIAQRAETKFREGAQYNKNIHMPTVSGEYRNGIFKFTFDRQSDDPKKTGAMFDEIFEIAEYVLNSYEVKDFSSVDVSDIKSAREMVKSREEILARKGKIWDR